MLDSRLGLEVHPFGLVYPGNANFNLGSLGISGTVYPYASFPGASFSNGGYASLAPGAGGQISTSTVGSLNEIATKTVNTHSIRFGFEGNILRYNQQNPESGFGNGSGTPGFTFDNRFTQQNVTTTSVGADPNSGDAFADMYARRPSRATNYTINPSYALQQIYIAPWVQDDWRVSKKLTINLGLRWDLESPYTERFNKLVTTFCTTCVNPLQSSVAGLPLYGGLQYTKQQQPQPVPCQLQGHPASSRRGLPGRPVIRSSARATGSFTSIRLRAPSALATVQSSGGGNSANNYNPTNTLKQSISRRHCASHRQFAGPGHRVGAERFLYRPSPRAAEDDSVHA